MAFDFSKLNFFSKMDARSRVLVLFAGIIGAGAGIYFLSGYLSSDSGPSGLSTIAKPPTGLHSTPGGEVTSEYYAALQNADKEAAEKAKISGTGALPTMVNTGMRGGTSEASCTVLCDDSAIDVKSTLNDWVSKGKIASDVSTQLQALIDKNVPVAEFAATLADLVKNGKLTPEQARELLDQYKKQHNYKAVQDSAAFMDDLIKSGALPLDVANTLLDAQKRGVSAAEYADMLQDMVKKGLISPETAQRLLNQYLQQQSQEAQGKTKTTLSDLVASGALTKEAAKEISALMDQNIPVDAMAAKLKQMVAEGKLTADTAKKILDAYTRQKALASQISSVNKMLKDAEDAAFAELTQLQQANKISAETATNIATAIQRNVTFDQFQEMINTMAQQNRLTPEIAKLKLADYKKVKDLRILRDKLLTLQANNASEKEYQDVLTAAVTAGVISPDDAGKLMGEYHTMRMQPEMRLGVPGEAGTSNPSQLLQQSINPTALAELTKTPGAGATGPGAGPGGISGGNENQVYTQAQLTQQREAAEREQQRLQQAAGRMSGYAGGLIQFWAPPVMSHMKGTPDDKSKSSATGGASSGSSSSSSAGSASGSSADSMLGAPLIKAGTILFAVLDTAVNSDYPDSPVLATIVDGKYKGAKLMGKLQITKGVSGQQDRIMLNFTLMNMDEWAKSKTSNAFAIDPDTARSALASSVNYHYMQRFGALMATSFLQGYGQAAMSSGGSQVASAFGTSSTNATLSPSSKMAVAVGQMAQAVGTATQNYTNRPPTVVVDSGVGLGILFMTDLS